MSQSQGLKSNLLLSKKYSIDFNLLLLIMGAVLLLLLLLFSLTQGAYKLAFLKVLNIVFMPSDSSLGSDEIAVIWQIRLPRVLSAVFVGASLAVAGAAIQGLFRNPLADAGLIGVSGGSMLAAASYIVLGSMLGISAASGMLGFFGLSFFAFLGGLISTFIVYRIASEAGQTFTTTMLLAGLAITATCGALTGLLTYFSTESQLRDISFWNLGSLSAANWSSLAVMSLVSIPAFSLIFLSSSALDSFLLGENEASYLGVNVTRSKRRLITATALLIGTAVATSGMIGFVGLVVPHLIRLWRGAGHRFLLPASALLGAALLLLADTLARTIIAPAELPIGILTALLGAPFFFHLILKAKKEQKLL